MSEARSQIRIEAELKVKIEALETELSALESELIASRGKLAGRKESTLVTLRAEMQSALERVNSLNQALYVLSLDSLEARDAAETQLQADRLKQALAGYCKKNKVNPELWKSIAS